MKTQKKDKPYIVKILSHLKLKWKKVVNILGLRFCPIIDRMHAFSSLSHNGK